MTWCDGIAGSEERVSTVSYEFFARRRADGCHADQPYSITWRVDGSMATESLPSAFQLFFDFIVALQSQKLC
jgi:hypothetical protein